MDGLPVEKIDLQMIDCALYVPPKKIRTALSGFFAEFLDENPGRDLNTGPANF